MRCGCGTPILTCTHEPTKKIGQYTIFLCTCCFCHVVSIHTTVPLPFIFHLGLRFWKASARQFYAVVQHDLHVTRKRRGEQDCDSSAEGMKAVLEKLDQICSVTKNDKVPMGLKIACQEVFMCKICHLSVLKPPTIVARCCRNIIGCQACVDTWYREDMMEKSCPLCRSPRGYSDTMALPTLDRLIESIKDLVDDEED